MATTAVSPATLASAFVARLLREVGRRGIAVHDLYRATGVSPTHDDPQLRVALHVYFKLWAALIERADDPELPIVLASSLTIDDMQMLGFLAMTSASGCAAVSCISHYLSLLTEGGAWALERRGDTLAAEWRRLVPGGAEQGPANEFAVAQFVRIVRELQHHDIAPTRITFRHEQPARIAAHERFFRCPIEWSSPVDGVELAAHTLAFTPVLANPGLHRFLRAQADAMLAQRAAARATIVEQIRDAIAVELPSGPPALSCVARRLAMSERSLRRTLHRDQQSFRQIVEHVRKARAIELLTNGSTSITDVSATLGFSDPSAFSRAFKRWCGCSPQRFARTAA